MPLLQEDPVCWCIFIVLACVCPSQLRRYRDGAACWISSSCYPDHTISRNSGTLGRPLVVRQMFLNPPTGSSRPLTSNTKKKGSEASTLATRWSANLVRSAHLVQRSRFFNQIGRQINRDAALLLLTLRRIVSQEVQLLKIYTLKLPAFMQSMFRVQIYGSRQE